MRAVFWNKLKDYRQSIPMILIMTALSMVLIYVFGRSFDGADQIRVAVADLDKTHSSSIYMDQVMAIEGFDMNKMAYEKGLEEVENGSVIALVVIEEGFEQGNAGATMYRTGEAMEHFTLLASIEAIGRYYRMDEAFIKGHLNQLDDQEIHLSEGAVRTSFEDQLESYPIMALNVVSVDGGSGDYDSLKHSFIGFILFFSMFTMVFGIGSIVEEKEAFVWQRQMVAPISAIAVMAANLLAALVVGMAQLALMVGVSRVVFGIDWGGSTGALLLVLAGFVLASTSLGLFMSTQVKSMQQLGAFSPVIIVSTSMIGGCMWPLEIIESEVLLFLADLTPQRWAYKGLQEVIVKGGGFGDVLMPLGILLFMSGVLITLASLPAVQNQSA